MPKALRADTVWWPLGFAVLASLFIFDWVGEMDAPKSCSQVAVTDAKRTAITVLDGIVNLDIQLATALVGLGAALLMGLRQSFRPIPSVAVLIFFALLAFAQSVLYGIWWKTRIASVWYRECLDLFSGEFVQRPYSLHVYCFMTGFVFLGIMVAKPFALRLNAAGDEDGR